MKSVQHIAHTDQQPFSLADHFDFGVVLLDSSKTIISWNNWLEQATNKKREDVLGKPLDTVFPDLANQRMSRAIDNAIRHQQCALLSHQIHGHLLPLYSQYPHETMTHRIIVKPMSADANAGACLIEVHDASDLLRYERLIAKQSNEIKALSNESLRGHALSDALFNHSFDGLIVIDNRGRINDCNGVVEILFGFSRNELKGNLIQSLLEKPGQQTIDVANELTQSVLELPLFGTTKQGKQFPALVSASPLHYTNSHELLLIIHDETRQQEIENQLASMQTRSELTLNAITDAVIVTNAQGLVTFMNRAAEQLTACAQQQALGKAAHLLLALTAEENAEPVLIYDYAPDAGSKTIAQSHTGRLKRRDRVCIDIEFTVTRLNSDSKRSGLVIVVHDLTERQNAQQKIAWQRSHDSLTGLVNRVEFEHRIAKLINADGASLGEHALLYIDIDQFKVINDLCGHFAGDELLRQLTSNLAMSLPEDSCFARFGGDEFGVLLVDHTVEHAQTVASQLHQHLRQFRYHWQDNIFSISISIGLVPISNTHHNSSALLSMADTACFFAKETGRDRTYTACEDDHDLRQRREEMNWVSHIQHALDHQSIALFGQTIEPLQAGSGLRTRIEILARMIIGDQFISPALFVPAAERYDVMPALDREIISKTFAVLSKLSRDKQMPINLNLSAKSITNESFLPFVEQAIRDSKLDARLICFEITETAAIANLDQATHFIVTLQNLGCQFALDDFGSGVSSLAYLKNLPLDYLKIDGTFVHNVMHNEMDLQMLEAINQLGKVMGVKTIAEYVENKALMQKLTAIGIDYAQGYALSKPEPLSNLISKI